MVIMTTVVISR